MKFMDLTRVILWQATAVLLILSFNRAMSQESVLTTGMEAAGDGGSTSYSVGLVAFETIETSAGSLTPGAQAPYEILFMEGINSLLNATDVKIYPNPAGDELKVKLGRLPDATITLRLESMDGRLITEKELIGDETALPVSDLAHGVYLLTLTGSHTGISTWKVIKK